MKKNKDVFFNDDDFFELIKEITDRAMENQKPKMYLHLDITYKIKKGGKK